MASSSSSKATGPSEPGYTLDEVKREMEPILKARGIKLNSKAWEGDFGPLLGQGAFGRVFKFESNDKNSKPKAVKLIQLTRHMDKECVVRESDTASDVYHRNILRVTSYGIYQEKVGFVYWYLFTDYCPGGNLESYLREKIFFASPYAQILMKQIAAGMGYIHNKNIIHRDLKPDNILIEEKDKDIWSIRLRIADFGLAKVYEEVSGEKFESTLRQYTTMTACGTIAYMAPELFRGKGGKCSDIWSMGVIAYRMLYGCVPFKSQQEMFRFISGAATGVPLPESSMEMKVMTSAFSEGVVDFLRQVLIKDPNKRISHTRFYRLAWIRQ